MIGAIKSGFYNTRTKLFLFTYKSGFYKICSFHKMRAKSKAFFTKALRFWASLSILLPRENSIPKKKPTIQCSTRLFISLNVNRTLPSFSYTPCLLSKCGALLSFTVKLQKYTPSLVEYIFVYSIIDGPSSQMLAIFPSR